MRGAIIRALAVALVAAVVAFCLKDLLFELIFAPKDAGFITYRILNSLASLTGSEMEPFEVPLISTGLARQFIAHMQMALSMGVIVASPYILYELFRFVSPALYDHERRYVTRMVAWGYAMFMLGVLVSYFVVFPLTFRFLGTYQVSTEVTNLITLDSYTSTLLTMSLALGLVFEMPVLAWLMAKLGFITDAYMRRFRKQAVVIILIIAAIITPTSDAFTLMIVALPMWLLYEASIQVVATAKSSPQT